MAIDFEQLLEQEKEQIKWTSEQKETIQGLFNEGWVFVESHEDQPVIAKPNTEFSVVVDENGKMKPLEN